MEALYYLLFGALSVVVALLEFSKTSKDRISTSVAFNSFKNNYIVVYSLMMAGDWLQGPYVYYLYHTYGFGKGEIGRLFIAGFGSSMLFGTIVGSLADKQGRKRACVTYCISYILSCITKHSPEFKVLMLGRILGGIATSLLFSAFESWLVAEHNKRGFEPQWLSLTFSKAIFIGNGLVAIRGFEPQWLSLTFSKAIFIGNGLVAIVCGLFANLLTDTLGFGPVSPFDAAACFLAIGMAIILSTWGENYGDPSESKDLLSQFKVAAVAIASDEKIALLGAIQSLFEGSMYTFVFLWTPVLSPNDEDIPHGFIFATFMLSSMLGSSIASRLMARATLKVEGYMQVVFAISSFTLLLPVITSFLITSSSVKGGSISLGGCILLVGFCTFEACVGIFWPSIMKMRSQYIPEEARSTIMNFFRIPLNIFVCIVLYNVDAFPMTVMFGMCSIFLFIASILQRRLMVVAESHRSSKFGTSLVCVNNIYALNQGLQYQSVSMRTDR
ncbi:molybdate-anion transporter [Cocos nucifera]|nr:molybdate-anion transporter [Cocos nucifera]